MVLKAQFSVRFDAVKIDASRTVPPMQQVVWAAEQPYDVIDDTSLQPLDRREYGKGHPLVQATAVSGVKGAVLIRLRTEFVDISQFWKAYAPASDVAEWLREHDRNVSLVALGYTGGHPLIWFASVPSACLAPRRPEISCLVFYRPANDGYTRLDEPQNMFRLNRFLLKPVDNAPEYWKDDRFNWYVDQGATKLSIYLRCGFEDALERSGKSLIMLHPWPNVSDFGKAETRDLPKLAEAAIRFLWAMQNIGKERGAIRLGRLGLAGFSAGGKAMWSALRTNRDAVDEVYSFDARGIDEKVVIPWFNAKPQSRCLRMTGGHRIAAHEAIRKAIGSTPRVTAFPASPAAYLKPGATPVWDHALSKLTQLDQDLERVDPDDWHQFAVFGSRSALPGPFTVTFLQEFLQASDF